MHNSWNALYTPVIYTYRCVDDSRWIVYVAKPRRHLNRLWWWKCREDFFITCLCKALQIGHILQYPVLYQQSSRVSDNILQIVLCRVNYAMQSNKTSMLQQSYFLSCSTYKYNCFMLLVFYRNSNFFCIKYYLTKLFSWKWFHGWGALAFIFQAPGCK